MSKNVYSIVLSDDIVRAVDSAAIANGTSRSNLINRILAESLGLYTHENYMDDIFASIEQFFAPSEFFKTDFGGGSLINVKTALQYKYNPGVKYCVEIYPGGNYMGQLRVSMRTQNNSLLEYLEQFYKLWIKLEQAYVGAEKDCYQYSNGKFYRNFRLPESENYQEAGEAIARYTNLLDICMKTFFSALPNSQKAIELTQAEYSKGLSPQIAAL